MPSIYIDYVEAGFFSPQSSITVPFAKFTDIGEIHCAGLNWIMHGNWKMRGRERHVAAVTVSGHLASVIDFSTSKTTKLMDAFAHLCQNRNIAIIPKSSPRPRRMIA